MHSHGRLREALFTEKEFASLSTDAKLFYGILLDRISLSKKNGWIDSDGYVYIIYTIAELQELLRMSHTTVTKLLYELDSVHGIGLIERYRQGNNRPSVIYVKNFVKRSRGKPVRYFVSGMPETGNPDCKELEIRIARNWKSGTQKNRSPDCKNLDGSNTKINKTEKNHTDKSKGNTPALEEKFSQYGRFKNVVLSEAELQELMTLFPWDYQKRIEEIERAILEETPYDLLICDMHFDFYGELRGDAGERTMKFLREKGIEIPIVFCSSQNYKVPGAYDNIYFSERANWEDDIRRVVRSL